MSAGLIRAGGAFYEILAQDKTDKGLSSAKAKLNAFANQVGIIGAALSGAAASGLAGFTAAVKTFTDVGSELDDISQRTGIGASRLAELKFAAMQSGASIQDVERALVSMARKGLDVEKFDRYAASVAAIEDPTQRAAMALEIFGKSGVKLIPMFADLAALSKEANLLGLVPKESDIKAAAALGDAFDKLRMTLQATLVHIGAALAPAVQSLAEIVIRTAAYINHFADNNRGLVRTAAAVTIALGSLGGAMIGLAIAVKIAMFLMNIGKIATMAYAFAAGAAAVANYILAGSWLAAIGPMGWLIGLVGALAFSLLALAAVLTNIASGGWFFRTMELGFMRLFSIAINTFSGILDALVSGEWELAGRIAMQGLRAAFAVGLSGLQEMIITFTSWATNKLATMFDDIMEGVKPVAEFFGMKVPQIGNAGRAALQLTTGVLQDAAIKVARQQATEAEDELNRLRKEARDARNKLLNPPGGLEDKAFKALMPINSTILETDKAVSQGAFSGTIAATLARNEVQGNIQERMLTEMKEQTVTLKDIAASVEDGGPEFTD